MTVVTAADELAAGEDADSPLTRRSFTHWPLPVGRVEVHDGLTFVHSSEPGGFSAEDYRRIPGGGRVELLDGVAVVRPAPTPRHQQVVRRLYQVLDDECPAHLAPFIGPLDLPVGSSVFAPDIQVLPTGDGPPALVAEVLSEHGRSHDRRVRLRGYQQAGVASYWVVDPDGASITVFELGGDGSYREVGSYTGGDVCALDRPFPVRFRVSELV